jgi:hypothetical protein
MTHDFGYQIDGGCLSKWGGGFPNFVKETMNKGMQCLGGLAKKSPGINGISGAARNLKGLANLMAGNKISLVCTDLGYDWDGVAGHASTSPKDKLDSHSVSHPYFSLSPNVQRTNSKFTADDKRELAKTIFHEQLHNLGYRHNGEKEEFPYTCEACCFGDFSTGNEKEKEAACKVCTEDYKNSGSKEYSKLSSY